MKELITEIQTVKEQCISALNHALDLDSLERIRISFMGRNGSIAAFMDILKSKSVDEKRVLGPLLNDLKASCQAAYDAQFDRLSKKTGAAPQSFDVTAYKPNQLNGSLHIYTQIIEQLSETFTSMGYTIVDGPEVETEQYNFTALNIPNDHPARDMHDTFWLSRPDRLLRTHTSSVQAHAMQESKPPFAIFAPGRCYRNEATDASHDFMFTQAEGMLVDKNVSMAQLLATARAFLQAFFEKKDLNIRVRPGYFPFVEPGVEIDATCPFCKNGCSICKKTGWIELLGAGLIHPNVLRASGIDPEIYSGFAFGFGIERLAMIKYGINDIRLFHSSNLQFLSQF